MASLAANTIVKFEGFRTTAYWDVNHYRVGFGSDTYGPDHLPVTASTTVTREQALDDLDYRITGFQNTIQRQIGADNWGNLDANTQAALTSVAYNYGSLPSDVKAAAISGDKDAIADAIASRSGDNGGVNASRREQEADLVRNGDGQAAGGGDGSTAKSSDSQSGTGSGAGNSPTKSDPCQAMGNMFGSLAGGGAGLMGQGFGALGGIVGQVSNMLGGGVLGQIAQGALTGNLGGAALSALGQFSGIPNLGGIVSAVASGNLGALAGAIQPQLGSMINNLSGGLLNNISNSLSANLTSALGSVGGQISSAIQSELKNVLSMATAGTLNQIDPNRIGYIIASPDYQQLPSQVQQDLQSLQSHSQGSSTQQVYHTMIMHLEALAADADFSQLPDTLRISVTNLLADLIAPDSVTLDADAFQEHMDSVLNGILALDNTYEDTSLGATLMNLMNDFVQATMNQSVTNATTNVNAGTLTQVGTALQGLASSGVGDLNSIMSSIGTVTNVANLATSLLNAGGLTNLSDVAKLAGNIAGIGGSVQGLLGAVQGFAATGNIGSLLGALPGGVGGAVQSLMSGNIGGMLGSLSGAVSSMSNLAASEQSAIKDATNSLTAMAGSFNLPLLFAHPCSSGLMSSMASSGLNNALNPSAPDAPAVDDTGPSPPGGTDAPIDAPVTNDPNGGNFGITGPNEGNYFPEGVGNVDPGPGGAFGLGGANYPNAPGDSFGNLSGVSFPQATANPYGDLSGNTLGTPQGFATGSPNDLMFNPAPVSGITANTPVSPNGEGLNALNPTPINPKNT